MEAVAQFGHRIGKLIDANVDHSGRVTCAAPGSGGGAHELWSMLGAAQRANEPGAERQPKATRLWAHPTETT